MAIRTAPFFLKNVPIARASRDTVSSVKSAPTIPRMSYSLKMFRFIRLSEDFRPSRPWEANQSLECLRMLDFAILETATAKNATIIQIAASETFGSVLKL